MRTAFLSETDRAMGGSALRVEEFGELLEKLFMVSFACEMNCDSRLYLLVRQSCVRHACELRRVLQTSSLEWG